MRSTMVAAMAPRGPIRLTMGRTVKFAGPLCFDLSPACGSIRSTSMTTRAMMTSTAMGAMPTQSAGATVNVNVIRVYLLPHSSANKRATKGLHHIRYCVFNHPDKGCRLNTDIDDKNQ